MSRSSIACLIKFAIDVPNVPRDAKMGQGIANADTLSVSVFDAVFTTNGSVPNGTR